MSLTRVPREILKQIVEHLPAPVAEKEELRKLLNDGTAKAYEDLLAGIERHYPQLRKDLEDIWAFRGRTAIHIFQLNAIRHLSVDEIQELLHEGMKQSRRRSSMRVAQDDDNIPSARIVEVTRAGKGSIEVWVRVPIERAFQYEEETLHQWATFDVLMRIDTSGGTPRAEVYSGLTNSRAIVAIVLGEILGGSVPTRGKKRADYWSPIAFAESDAVRIAQKLKMDEYFDASRDPKGKYSEIWFKSKLKDGKYLPLDKNDERAKPQEGAARYERYFQLDVLHQPSKVKETVWLCFNFRNREYPHIRSEKKVSRRALDIVLDALYSQIGDA